MDPNPSVLLPAAAGQAPAPQPGGSLMPASDPLAPLSAAHDQASAQYTKLVEAQTKLDHIRSGLAELARLGDTISTDDVVKEAGKLVASGVSPMELAELLADMPPGGPGLAAWVSQHATSAAMNEAKLGQMVQMSRHQMGTKALQLLAGHAAFSPAQAPLPAMTGPLAPEASNAP